MLISGAFGILNLELIQTFGYVNRLRSAKLITEERP